MAKESTKKSTVSKKANETKNTKKVAPKATKTATKKVETKKVVKAPVKEAKKVETKIVTEVKQEVVKPVETKKLVKVEKKQTFKEVVKANVYLILLCAICSLLIINIILVIVGHKVELKDGKEVVASVTGKSITAEELFETLKEATGTDTVINAIDAYIVKKSNLDEDAVTEYAQTQLDSIKSYYEAQGSTWADTLKTYGYADDDALLSEIAATYRKKLVVNNYLASKVTDEEIQKYYDENIYGDYTAKHILIKPETTDGMTDEQVTAANDAAKALAEEVITKLNNGEDWASLVKTYSDDTGSVDTEGLIENFTKGDEVDEFWNAVLTLEDGKYTTTPVKTTYGYHVILKVSNTEKPTLKSVKDSVIDSIVAAKLSADDTLYNTTWAAIRESYKLKINDTTIKAAYEKALAE